MGLPGSGKTTFAEKLMLTMQDVEWINADVVRKAHNDWDFSLEGRLRQALRLRDMADKSDARHVICDFVAPMAKQREMFEPDFLIWMDTIDFGRYEDTNALFEPPSKWDMRITEWSTAPL